MKFGRAKPRNRNARLRAAFEELPARLRREGLLALDAAASKRESERYYARLELRGLIENRLGSAQPDASDTQILRLLLPPARVATTNLGAIPNSSSRTTARRTASAGATTNDEVRASNNRRPLGARESLDGSEVAQLRAQARPRCAAMGEQNGAQLERKIIGQTGRARPHRFGDCKVVRSTLSSPNPRLHADLSGKSDLSGTDVLFQSLVLRTADWKRTSVPLRSGLPFRRCMFSVARSDHKRTGITNPLRAVTPSRATQGALKFL